MVGAPAPPPTPGPLPPDVLLLLCRCLTDPDPGVVQDTHTALRMLLADSTRSVVLTSCVNMIACTMACLRFLRILGCPTHQHPIPCPPPSARALLASVPCHVAALLAPFVATRAPPTPPPLHPATRHQWDVQQTALWDASSQSFEAWACGVTSALLWHVDDPLLVACRGVAARSAALAARVLPLVLENIAVQGGTMPGRCQTYVCVF